MVADARGFGIHDAMKSPNRSCMVVVAACAIPFAVLTCKSDPKPAATADPPGSAVPMRGDGGQLRLLPGLKQRPRPLPLASAIPIPAASVDDSVNPNKLPPYAGPTGVVEGVVKFKGEKPVEVSLSLPDACRGAAATYGKSFREGSGRTAADVLVAVTGYQGYVPAPGPNVRVVMNDCAFNRRTVALTFGQRIELLNDDSKNSYIPMLVGESAPAHMVAVPHGDPVKLYPTRVGHYLLADEMNRPWMKADVYVLKYATFAVTGLDGAFRIEGIPVGKVNVSADVPWIVPAIDKTVEVTVEEGKTTKVDFTLEVKKAPPASAGSGAAPAQSGASVVK